MHQPIECGGGLGVVRVETRGLYRGHRRENNPAPSRGDKSLEGRTKYDGKNYPERRGLREVDREGNFPAMRLFEGDERRRQRGSPPARKRGPFRARAHGPFYPTIAPLSSHFVPLSCHFAPLWFTLVS